MSGRSSSGEWSDRALAKIKESSAAQSLINEIDSLLTLSDRVPRNLGGTLPSTDNRLAELEHRVNGSIDTSSFSRKKSEETLRAAGSFVTVVVVIMFFLSIILSMVKAIEGGTLNVSTSRDTWPYGYPLPMLAFNEAPAGHSIMIQQCTIYDGDFFGRVCRNLTGLVDYDCPELRKDDEFQHYSKNSSWCINSAAFMAATDAARVEGTFGLERYDYVQLDLLRDSGAPISGFYNIFLYDHTLSLTDLQWTNWVYNINPVAWSGIEIYFKHVKTVTQNFFLAEKQTNYLTYEHQYTRFDEIGSWAAGGSTSARPSVLTFYLRSSLYIERNILSPDLKADEMLAAIGGSWGFFELVALGAMMAIALLIKCAGSSAKIESDETGEQKSDTSETNRVMPEPPDDESPEAGIEPAASPSRVAADAALAAELERLTEDLAAAQDAHAAALHMSALEDRQREMTRTESKLEGAPAAPLTGAFSVCM